MFVVNTLFAQVISVHPLKPANDTVWVYDVNLDSPPDPLSCRAGEAQYYRLNVSYESIQINYIDDTVDTDKREWTEEDKNEAEKKFNEDNKQLLDDMLEQENNDRQTDLGQNPLMDELEQTCLDEFNDLIDNRWNNADYFLCIEDCPPSPIQECKLFTENERIEGAKVEYQFRHQRLIHSADWDEDAKPPYEVEITYSLVLHAEAWVYFMVVCVCQETSLLASVTPPETGEVSAPWDQIDLTGERMKPGFPFLIPDDNNFPWFPVIGGVTGVGVATYFLTRDKNKPSDCSFTASAQSSNSTCGQSNGSAVISTTPSDSYSYVWSNGATTSSLQNASAGSYSATVTRVGTTCNRVVSVTIANVNPSFTTTVTTNAAHCGEADGSATVSVTPPGPSYTFLWSNGSIGTTVSNLASGSYFLTVSAGGACMNEFPVTIGELPPTFEITFTSTPANCGMSDGAANVIVTPEGNYTYMWSNGNTSAQASGLAAGEYNITISIPGTNCSKTIMANVGEIPPTFELSFNTTPSECGQSNGTGNINVNPSGNYFYSWSNGSSEAQAIGLASGVYQVTVTLAGTSCSKDTSVTIGELPPTFIISSSTTPSGCTDSTGTASIIVIPPGEYTYAWSNGMTGSHLTGLATGEYTVTVTITGTTCSNTATVTVGQTGVGFTGTLSVDAADCGVANGSGTITMDPIGEYSYLWSNQQTGPVAQSLAAGDYSVVVTDMNGCSSSFSATVGEDPAEYISIVSTTPGTCIGGGDITFTLTTPVPPGSGPLVLDIGGPGGSISLSLAPGTYQLSSFINVPAGNYMFSVYDQSIGSSCIEIINEIVPDNTPALIVTDDFYTTPGGQPVFENALGNDSGLNIQMTSVSGEFGGTVTFNNSGEFIFTPDQGFSGDASFTYVVTDTCGTTATGVVTIFVEEVICDFNLDVTTTPASCGLSDGNIFVEVVEPGNYSYTWETGETGPVLTDVPAGTYTVTVEDVDLGCTLEFTISLSENPADYISDVEVTQPNCTVPGEIQFTASTTSQNPLIMFVEHPGGNDLFFIDPGIIRLSDFVPIIAGEYIVEVSDAGAGPDCFENFTVNIVAAPVIEIAVEAIFPPSSPSAMDGSVFIVTIIQGDLPYTVFLNGIPYFTAIEHNFSVEGLGVGEYTIQIMDANGCFSNILMVIVPPPDIILSFGTGVVHYPYDEQNPEHISNGYPQQWSNGLLASLQYYIGNRAQEIRMIYTATNRKNIPDFDHGYMELQYLSEMKRIEWKQFLVSLDGGLGVRTVIPYLSNTNSSFPQFWTLRASAAYNVSRTLKLECNFSVQGWTNIQKPVIEFSVTMPFMNRIGYLNALRKFPGR